MTLGNMRELGVRSLFVSCWNCHHQAVLCADRWPDDVAVPTFGRASAPAQGRGVNGTESVLGPVLSHSLAHRISR
jgi:hypothetical protein